MPLVPYVVERSGREERVFDIYSRLLKDRIIFLQGEVNDDSASSVVAQMLFLQFDQPKSDIHLYINSPGGSVTAGLSIYDVMQYVTCDVATYCIGTGKDIAPLAPGIRDAFRSRRIVVEPMSTGAAVRTYNILLGERRRVGALLIAVE